MPALSSTSRPGLHAILAGAIDYAGLFPPAALGLPEALARYLEYRRGSDGWALGRFVAPAERLSELAAALATATAGGQVPVSVLVGDPARDLLRIAAFERAADEGRARVVAVEARATTPETVRMLLDGLPPRWTRYVEIPLDGPLDALLDAIQGSGGFAKVRTGGVTAEAFPAPEALVRFLAGVVRRRLGFKATAGLHHALRGAYPLTYAPDSARAPMYGYLNLFLAAALLAAGGSDADARAALLEDDAAALRVEADALVWRGRRVSDESLRALRRDLFHGFGSCSFREPLDEVALAA